MKIEMVQNIGIVTKGRNQIILASSEPRIGLKTFPSVLAVSIIPSDELTFSFERNISPTNGKTIGKAPAAPTPCNVLPIRTSQ